MQTGKQMTEQAFQPYRKFAKLRVEKHSILITVSTPVQIYLYNQAIKQTNMYLARLPELDMQIDSLSIAALHNRALLCSGSPVIIKRWYAIPGAAEISQYNINRLTAKSTSWQNKVPPLQMMHDGLTNA